MSDTATRALRFCLSHLKEQRAARPLFVGIQGPQGSGKSYLAEHLQKTLSSPPHSLRVAQLSLDDLYLPHSDLLALAEAHPDNALLKGRGLPGTHDVELGRRVLASLAAGEVTELPIYDKSAHAGAGDRSTKTVHVDGQVHIVIFEGWMLGFLPFDGREELQSAYDALGADAYARRHSFESLLAVNDMLKAYERDLWTKVDVMIALRPSDSSYPWAWRLQQEHALKASHGGRGMSDEQVHAFVDRYAPAYDLWDFELPAHAGRHSWQSDLLRIELDRDRRAINAD